MSGRRVQAAVSDSGDLTRFVPLVLISSLSSLLWPALMTWWTTSVGAASCGPHLLWLLINNKYLTEIIYFRLQLSLSKSVINSYIKQLHQSPMHYKFRLLPECSYYLVRTHVKLVKLFSLHDESFHFIPVFPNQGRAETLQTGNEHLTL